MNQKLGIGLATGMFFHAPAGTELPKYPAEKLDAAWKSIGDVSEDGIKLTTDKSTEAIKNWANVIRRVVMKDHSEKIQCSIIDTTEESLKATLGSSNVKVTAPDNTHGTLIEASLSSGELPPPEAFLWLMKDGDDMMGIGCTEGQVMSVDNVSFKPGTTINWTPTITAMGDDGFKFITDDGNKKTV